MKTCRDCEEVLPASSFSKNKKSTDGLCNRCKSCQSAYYKKWREGKEARLAAYHRQYREENAEELREKKRLYYEENKEYFRKYREENRERYLELYRQRRIRDRGKREREQREREDREYGKDWPRCPECDGILPCGERPKWRSKCSLCLARYNRWSWNLSLPPRKVAGRLERMFLDEVGWKKCPQCKHNKPLSEYYRKNDGYDWICASCAKERQSDMYWQDPDAARAYNRKLYYQDRAKRLRRATRYRRENRDLIRKRDRRFRIKNAQRLRREARKIYHEKLKHDPHYQARQRAHTRNRRARLRSIDGVHSFGDVAKQWHKQNGECFWCGERCGSSPLDYRTYDVDHLTPVSRSEARPTNYPRNLVIACDFCNSSKNNKLPIEFKHYRLLSGMSKTYHYGASLRL